MSHSCTTRYVSPTFAPMLAVCSARFPTRTAHAPALISLQSPSDKHRMPLGLVAIYHYSHCSRRRLHSSPSTYPSSTSFVTSTTRKRPPLRCPHPTPSAVFLGDSVVLVNLWLNPTQFSRHLISVCVPHRLVVAEPGDTPVTAGIPNPASENGMLWSCPSGAEEESPRRWILCDEYGGGVLQQVQVDLSLFFMSSASIHATIGI